VSAALRGLPEIARRVEEFDAVILQRAAEEKTIAVFPMRGGILREPIFLRFGELSGEPRSVEEILRAGLDSPENEPANASGKKNEAAEPGVSEEGFDSPEKQRRKFGLHTAPPELTEHLSLLTRWFYSNPREGEIFFREADWPYRRLLRACSRLLAPPAGESPAGAGSRPARDRIRRLHAFSKAHRPPKK
jgi:hypothetical protein